MRVTCDVTFPSGFPPVFIYCDNMSDKRLRFAMVPHSIFFIRTAFLF